MPGLVHEGAYINIEVEVMVWEPGAEPLCASPAPVPARKRRVFEPAGQHGEVLKW